MDQKQIVERLEAVAQLTHTIYRAYMTGSVQHSLPWDNLDEHTRESCRDGVKAVLEGAVATPQQNHENWLRFKQEAGWTHGEEIDFSRKQHPCIRAWESLPALERMKDHLFVAAVRAGSALWDAARA